MGQQYGQQLQGLVGSARGTLQAPMQRNVQDLLSSYGTGQAAWGDRLSEAQARMAAAQSQYGDWANRLQQAYISAAPPIPRAPAAPQLGVNLVRPPAPKAPTQPAPAARPTVPTTYDNRSPAAIAQSLRELQAIQSTAGQPAVARLSALAKVMPPEFWIPQG